MQYRTILPLKDGRKRIKVLSSDIINSINCSLFGDVDIENRISYSANGS